MASRVVAPPYMQNPNGSPPNYDDPITLVSQTNGITITMIALASYFVFMRIGSKFYSAMKFGVDDAFCLVAFALAVTYAAVVISMRDTARHSWDIPVAYLDEAWAKRTVILGIIYGPAIWFAKAAILTLYLRVFGPIQWLRDQVFLGLGTLFIAYWASIPFFAVYCSPHNDDSWDSALVGQCQYTTFLQLLQGIVGVASDVFLLALPFPVIYKLNLSLVKKLGVAFVFLHGIFAVVSSALALYYRTLQWKGHDPTWNMQNTYICLIVEMFMTIIVSSMPATSSAWNKIWTTSLANSRYVSLVKSLLFSSTSKSASSGSGSLGLQAQQHGPVEVVRKPDPKAYTHFYESASVPSLDSAEKNVSPGRVGRI